MKGHNEANSTGYLQGAYGHITAIHQLIIWIVWCRTGMPLWRTWSIVINRSLSMLHMSLTLQMKGLNEANSTGYLQEA